MTAPTCTAGGCTTYTCSTCGDSYVADEVAALGHRYESAVTAPTCTAGGYTTYTCAACGYSFVGDETAATGHNYESVVTAPTCTEAGCTTYTCACGDSYTESVPAPGHNWTAATCTAPKTCSVCGTTEGEALGHIMNDVWAFDANGHWHVCTGCGMIGEVIAHVPGAEATEENPQLCTECGYIIAPALHVHAGVEVKGYDATCSKAGQKTYYECSCGTWYEDAACTVEITDKASVVIPVAGHADADKDGKCDDCKHDVSPKTGDNSMAFASAVVMLAAGIAILFLSLQGKKRKA